MNRFFDRPRSFLPFVLATSTSLLLSLLLLEGCKSESAGTAFVPPDKLENALPETILGIPATKAAADKITATAKSGARIKISKAEANYRGDKAKISVKLQFMSMDSPLLRTPQKKQRSHKEIGKSAVYVNGKPPKTPGWRELEVGDDAFAYETYDKEKRTGEIRATSSTGVAMIVEVEEVTEEDFRKIAHDLNFQKMHESFKNE